MADDDWKKRVGIKINFSSDSSEDEGVNKNVDHANGNHLSPHCFDSIEGSFDGEYPSDDILKEFGDYGSTPPRTRISRRQRERRQREKEELCNTKSVPKLIQAKTRRRNTMDSLYFTELMERSENNTQQETDQLSRPESNKRNKRTLKLLRGSERDLKLDISGMEHPTHNIENGGENRAESLPAVPPQPAIKVETCNRFFSLTSKLVACNVLKKKSELKNKPADCPDERVDFYNMFSKLIRMGSSDKQNDKNPRRHLSREEHLWQNELKDLIWLELQAWHADRTPTEQDEYVCKARQNVADLLNDIMSYRFERKEVSTVEGDLRQLPAPVSTQSSDSGVSGDGKEDFCEPCSISDNNSKKCVCAGCLSMYCHSCVDIQNQALKDVEKLLQRLEAAEALYPSSKAFAAQHPLYKCSLFVGRVKAMCLWYNMTKHHRLKMLIIGKLMYLHQPKNYSWPQVGPLNEDDPNVSSGVGTDISDDNYYQDFRHTSRSGSVEGKPFRLHNRTVQFDVDSSSPSDSNNSNFSHGTTTTSSSDGGLEPTECQVYFYSASMIASMGSTFCSYKESTYPYRKYMEEVLKTRGLRKAINFLEKLHHYVLRKAMITLAKPAESAYLVINNNDTAEKSDALSSQQEITLAETVEHSEDDEEEELRRYGFWSCEAQSLGLPSYRAAFLFLSRIPLEMIHEFLRMRLEQKPNQPSVLSIRQLMRELKEGLRIAVLHRQRYLTLIHTVLWDKEKETLELYESVVSEFDQSMKAVLKVYLEYVQQWVLMVQQEGYQKNLLEEEWCFVRTTCPKIPGGKGMASSTFCHIASSMLGAITTQLVSKCEQLKQNMCSCDASDDESSPKQTMLTVCREFQILFNETREKALKAVAFSKTLRKDLENGAFKEGISPKCNAIIAEALEELKKETLSFRVAITSSLKSAEETCDVRDMSEVDDTEKSALVSRCREILHQGYKFGFEYHKEVCRLVTGDAREKLARGMISFAQQWMHFVKERCERGRGLRPRWANQGLDFLMTVCEPQNTNFLDDQQFEALKSSIDECISHVIGTATPTSSTPPFHPHNSRSPLDHYPRSRGSSPSPRSRTPTYRVSRSQPDTAVTPAPPSTQHSLSAQNSHSGTDSPSETVDESLDGAVAETLHIPLKALPRIERVREAVKKLDRSLEESLRIQELIGSVTDTESEDKIHIKSRSVTFSWQRGIKIGQGRFGKVYTAVNNETGELMAMKEIQLQPNDHRTIRRVAEELRIFEGIHHSNLVRYYGVEIHREEMLIFMEFCTEGTLESLVAAAETSGLPEVLIRRYTRQLLQAVAALHDHGVVHRDIKSANIFLTDEGNCLKLGDFGSAVKIKAHTTLPGELQGFVGTQAYMAPEVFMKTNTEGHGRAADIWSVGCVVVEMSSGKRPWAEFDSNYQIMFKVGMGETPAVPDSLSEEGHQFLQHCLQHDPRQRASASDLLHHTFVKIEDDDECISTDIPSLVEDFLKDGVKRVVK